MKKQYEEQYLKEEVEKINVMGEKELREYVGFVEISRDGNFSVAKEICSSRAKDRLQNIRVKKILMEA